MKTFISLLLVILLNITLYSQSSINGAESVAYHSESKSYFVSSLLGNKIYKIDSLGEQTVFYEDIKAGGNCMKGDTLFFSGATSVKGIDIKSKEIVFDVQIEGAEMLDGVAYDDNGNLYVVEVLSNYIVMINMEDKSQTIIAEEGIERNPQDIYFDRFQNRLLVCSWANGSAIVQVSLDDYSVSKVKDSFGRFDGITIDEYGLVYLSTHTEGGRVIMYDNNFLMEPFVIETGLEEPAGLEYNKDERLLAVPNFVGGVVEFIELPEQFLYPLFESQPLTGNLPLEVDFQDKTVSSNEVISWSWDFDNDGSIDSREQNPAITYNEAGTYDVRLTVETEFTEESILYEDYIKIFDGESSILLDENNSKIILPAAPELNLTEKITVEAFVKPYFWPSSARGSTVIDKEAIKIFITGFASGDRGDFSFITQFRIDGSPSLLLSAADSTIKLHEWQHIAVTYNSESGEAKMYRNGNELQTILIGNAELNGPLQDNIEEDIVLGNDANSLSNYNGLIDEIRLWNVVRNAGELEEYAVKKLNGNEEGLIGYWSMNEGSGNIIADITTNENDGSIEDGSYDHGVRFDQITSVNSKYPDNVLPNEIVLYQNYPNPFNPSTVISFQLALGSHVELTIYDILGREVALLVNKEMPPGSYEIDFDASYLTSGVYFYRLNTSSFTQIRKMILMK